MYSKLNCDLLVPQIPPATMHEFFLKAFARSFLKCVVGEDVTQDLIAVFTTVVRRGKVKFGLLRLVHIPVSAGYSTVQYIVINHQ